METFEERFDENFSDVEFLHGVPVALPKKTRDEMLQFFKEELKRITDLMIGEEVYCSPDAFKSDYLIVEGMNKQRKHCIDIIKKYV